MSEYLAVDPERQLRLRAVIDKLHGGASVAEVKREFAAIIKGATAAEIAAMEQALVDSGFPVEEVQRLCEVHVEVFEASLEKGERPRTIGGHPLHTFMAENREAEGRIRALRKAARAWAFATRYVKSAAPKAKDSAAAALADLQPLVVHYTRKENQLFPYLERHGFTGPSKVMWGKHDEIRGQLKALKAALDSGEARAFRSAARALGASVGRMIFMEEHILYPEAERRLGALEWAAIRQGEAAIGYAWVQPGAEYDAWAVLKSQGRKHEGGAGGEAAASPNRTEMVSRNASSAEAVALNTGSIAAEVLDLALRALPVDISVVDEDDRVLYYSDSPERIFPRSPAVIGRAVQNCHPQRSVATVERILKAFKDGSKDEAKFWIQMGPRLVVIQYRALRDTKGRYRGALEVSQDATPLRELQGERRLLDWET